MALTDAALKALKPRDRTYTISDERGLYMEVLPTGGMIWRYRYYLNRKQEKLTLGKYPALTLKGARSKRDAAAQLVESGISPARKKQLAKNLGTTGSTVGQFAELFLREVVAKDRKDLTSARRYFEKSIIPMIGAKQIADVTVDDVRSVIWKKKDEGFDAAAGQIRGWLKRLFDHAIAKGLVSTNPVLVLPMRTVHRAKSRDRALLAHELVAFLRAAFESNVRRQFKVALHLLLLTLVRKGELLSARWEDVDFEHGEWHIPAERSKNAKPHIVYLSRQALQIFKELKSLAGESGLVMPGRGSLTKPFAHNALNNALNTSLQGLPIVAFVVHDLRRTATTHLAEAGFDPDVIEKALNHTMPGTRGVYNRAEYAEQRKAMLQAWADTVDGYLGFAEVSKGRFKRVA